MVDTLWGGRKSLPSWFLQHAKTSRRRLFQRPGILCLLGVSNRYLLWIFQIGQIQLCVDAVTKPVVPDGKILPHLREDFCLYLLRGR